MKIILRILIFVAAIIFNVNAFADDPLPSWNDGAAKKAILNFIAQTSDKTNPNYVPEDQRIATFDQDGTLWVEQPMYTQVIFALNRVATLAPKHPEWKNQEPFKSLFSSDKAAITKFSEKDFGEIVAASETGIPVEDFQTLAKDWLTTAKNPRWQRTYTELVYQPMIEVMNYFRANGYKTYIVTGGGQEFVRAYSEHVYGVQQENVIGSAFESQYANGVLIAMPKILLNDDFAGKAKDIFLFLGKPGQAAFGNSTGDQQMLEYTQAGKGAHLLMLVHHDDAVREYAYGPDSKVGTFSDALMAEANQRGWQVISMKKDWKRIFSFE